MTEAGLKELAAKYKLSDAELNELSQCTGTDVVIERAAQEISQRPRVLPLNQRHQWTPAEMESVRQNVAAGMPRDKAVQFALGAK